MKILDDQMNATGTYGLLTEVSDEVHSSNAGSTLGFLLDLAQGGTGYYGAFSSNVHAYRSDDAAIQEGMLAAASARNVPIWNSDRFLNFTRARHDATISNVAWNASTLSFTAGLAGTSDPVSVIVSTATFNNAPIGSVKVNNMAASYNIQTIKGIDYAFVMVNAGTSNFSVTYTADTTAAGDLQRAGLQRHQHRRGHLLDDERGIGQHGEVRRLAGHEPDDGERGARDAALHHAERADAEHRLQLLRLFGGCGAQFRLFGDRDVPDGARDRHADDRCRVRRGARNERERNGGHRR